MTKKETGSLLSAPATAGSREESEVKFWRGEEEGTYENSSENFVLPLQGRNYQRQYFHLYRKRLECLRPRVTEAAKKQLGPQVKIRNLCDLDNEDEDEAESASVLVAGFLFKHQPLKPNILQELSEDNALSAVQPILGRKSKYISEDDEIILEDDLQRIKLLPSRGNASAGGNCGKFDMAKLSSGVVCGVLGHIGRKSKGDGGKFFVEDIVFPATPSPSKVKNVGSDRYLAILSGLNLHGGFSGANADAVGPLELAVSWLTGEGGEMVDQASMSKVERLIVAGNSLADETRDKDEHKRAKYLTRNKEATSVEAVNALDDVLAQLADTLDLDLMPGPNDPANVSLPQQPLHKCLFPKTGVYPTFQGVTNPYRCALSNGEVEVLGTSGQNLDDLMLNTSMEEPIEALESLLDWGHLAPTCPDTLGCYPYHDKDPFVINRKPNIFFAANQKTFSQKTLTHDDGTKTLCLSIPEFSATRQICFVNLKTLECQQITFECDLD